MHPYAISSEMQMNPIACCDINTLYNNWMQRLIQVLCSQLPTCMAVMVSVHRKHRESRAWLSVEWLKTACSNIPLNSQRKCLSVTPIASWYFDVSWFLCLCLAVVPAITIYHRVSQHIHVFYCLPMQCNVHRSGQASKVPLQVMSCTSDSLNHCFSCLQLACMGISRAIQISK